MRDINHKKRTIEIATYLGILLAFLVVFPWLGKSLDSRYFNYDKILASLGSFIIIGIFLAATGAMLALWAVYLFKFQGKGTPNPSLPPKNLVVTGPYKYSRNPMALGGVLFLTGQSFLYYSPTLFMMGLLFGAAWHYYAKYVEEPALKKRFGSAYEKYMKKTPRFIPRLRA